MTSTTNGCLPPMKELDEFEAPIYEFFTHMHLGLDDSEHQTWDIDKARAQVRFEYATRGPPARISYRLFVTPQMSNRMGTLHGGCAATLVDNLSSTILIGVAKPGIFQYGGVSRNLHFTYLRPAPVNTEIRIISEVVHVGRRLALLKAEIRRVDNDELCVVADHQKANTDPEVNVQKL